MDVHDLAVTVILYTASIFELQIENAYKKYRWFVYDSSM